MQTKLWAWLHNYKTVQASCGGSDSIAVGNVRLVGILRTALPIVSQKQASHMLCTAVTLARVKMAQSTEKARALHGHTMANECVVAQDSKLKCASFWVLKRSTQSAVQSSYAWKPCAAKQWSTQQKAPSELCKSSLSSRCQVASQPACDNRYIL